MFKKYPTIRSRIAHLVTPGSLSERAISIASIVLICGICWLDSKTHSDIRLRILYMFPLAMLALHVRRGRTAFLGFALVASCEATSLLSTHLPFAPTFIEALVGITGDLLVVVLARAVRDNYLNLRLRSTTLEAAANGMMITDFEGPIAWANHAFTTMSGYSKEEVLGKNPRLLKSGEQPESYYAELWSTISSGKVWQGEIVNRRKDGTTYTEEMTITPVTQDLGSLTDTYFIAIKQDITERKQAEQALRTSEKRYRLLFERNMAGGFCTNFEGRLLEGNHPAARPVGYDSPEEVMALSVTSLYHTASDRETFLRKLKSEKSLTNHEMKLRRKNGDSTWVIGNISLVDDNSGVGGIIEGTLVDITERKVAEERVQYLAYYDGLTGLPNRTLLQDRLTKALASARRQKCKVALLFLDLDRFKDINDSLGHSVGDLFLQAVAERLKRFAREQDTAARVGGDEFVIVLTAVKDVADAAVAAERIMNAMTAACVIQGHSLSISCGVGICIFPEHGTDCETLIKNADAAMYCTKQGGRNRFRFFTEDMNTQVMERLTLENSLRLALDREELFMG